MHHRFQDYGPYRGHIPGRTNGVMVATDTGQVTAWALDQLAGRGVMFVRPGDQIYEGQIVGEHCKDNDIPVNAAKLKHLTNMRAAAKDATVVLKPPRRHVAGAGPGVHRQRRAGGTHPGLHPPPQALAEGMRPPPPHEETRGGRGVGEAYADQKDPRDCKDPKDWRADRPVGWAAQARRAAAHVAPRVPWLAAGPWAAALRACTAHPT